MHHSLKIKILDLDHIESIVEQDITDVEAEKILGGTLSVSASQVSSEISVGGALSVNGSKVTSLPVPGDRGSYADPLIIPLHPSLISKVDLQLQIVKLKEFGDFISNAK